jgi:uncharacterized spore protein YtfJ
MEGQDQSFQLIERLFTVAQPGAVFGEPVSAAGRTIITASEVYVGMGVGFGFGAGSGPAEGEEAEESEGEQASGMGGGGGGGGGASGRPVAVVDVSDEGVQIEPVVDATKIALAFFTALGSMFFMLTRMRRAASGRS